MKQNKEKYIHIRIAEDVKNEILLRAKERGLTLSTLVNMLLANWLFEQQQKVEALKETWTKTEE